MAAVAAVLIAVVVAPGVAEAKRLSLTDAKWAITKVARADYLAQQRADAGQELIFKLQAYGVRECDRRSRRYVVCAYSIIRTDDELTQGSECVTIVGAFRPKHSRRVRTEILRDARCFDW